MNRKQCLHQESNLVRIFITLINLNGSNSPQSRMSFANVHSKTLRLEYTYVLCELVSVTHHKHSQYQKPIYDNQFASLHFKYYIFRRRHTALCIAALYFPFRDFWLLFVWLRKKLRNWQRNENLLHVYVENVWYKYVLKCLKFSGDMPNKYLVPFLLFHLYIWEFFF